MATQFDKKPPTPFGLPDDGPHLDAVKWKIPDRTGPGKQYGPYVPTAIDVDINKLYSRLNWSLKCVPADVKLCRDEDGLYFAKESIPGFQRRVPADSLLYGFLEGLEGGGPR